MMKRTLRLLTAMCLVPALLLLSACATTSSPVSEDDKVKERAEARWNTLLERDYETAFSYYSPGYRSTVDLTDFIIENRLRKIQWTSAKYIEHECEEKACTFKFRLGYSVRSPVPGVDVWRGFDVTRDRWVKVNGEWWYVPQED